MTMAMIMIMNDERDDSDDDDTEDYDTAAVTNDIECYDANDHDDVD